MKIYDDIIKEINKIIHTDDENKSEIKLPKSTFRQIYNKYINLNNLSTSYNKDINYDF